MEDVEEPLRVFALNPDGSPLRALRDALQRADPAASIGVALAGEASDEELDDWDWETAFVRWAEPELHEVFLLTRDTVGQDDEADAALQRALQLVGNRPISADSLLVGDHLRRARTVYRIEILPALLADDDHAAWGALDGLLRALAEQSDGLIYAEAEGFFDSEGEPLLAEDEIES